MKSDMIIAGVGGQGILSMAYVLCQAALERGWNVKQAEVHGMAQRGGAVQSHLRISSDPIASDLIPEGNCDLLVSVEPLEAARYLGHLSRTGSVVTSTVPLKNIGNYPPAESILAKLEAARSVVAIDAEALAKEAGSVQAQNTVVLGAASHFLEFPAGALEKWIGILWKPKGPRIVDTNLKAFSLGRNAARGG